MAFRRHFFLRDLRIFGLKGNSGAASFGKGRKSVNLAASSSRVRIPRTVKASAMSERWQRHGTASAHINAIRPWFANRINSWRLSANSGVCM